MADVIDWLVKLVTNDAFGGVLGATLVASIFFALRSIPGYVLTWAEWRLVTCVTVNNDDAAFDRVSEWLATLKSVKLTATTAPCGSMRRRP